MLKRETWYSASTGTLLLLHHYKRSLQVLENVLLSQSYRVSFAGAKTMPSLIRFERLVTRICPQTRLLRVDQSKYSTVRENNIWAWSQGWTSQALKLRV